MDSRDRNSGPYAVSHGKLSRRGFVRGLMCSALVALGAGTVFAACAPDQATAPASQPSPTPVATAEPSDASSQEPVPTPGLGDLPAGSATIRLAALGEFDFDPTMVTTLRPDIFQAPHFSVFDIVAYLGEQGLVDLTYHYDESMATHVIDSIIGPEGEYINWWYRAYYAGGWPERNVFRMDQFPFKNGMTIELYLENSDKMALILETFGQEVSRLKDNDARVILPEVIIETRQGTLRFDDVLVHPHNTRPDVLQPGVITALDALLSLRDQGQLEKVGLTWHEQIGRAEPVDNYFVEVINQAEAVGTCGFVYESGPRRFQGFTGSHIHLPSDVRVIVSPEYAYWFWICL